MPHLKLAVRTLFKSPFVTAVAVFSLALGIGANAAIFSLFNQLLLRPLPVPEPGSLVNLAGSDPNPPSQSCGIAGGCDIVFSYPMFRDLENRQTVFTGIAAHCGFQANLAVRRQTLDAEALYVSGSYFPVLELTPALGRLLARTDDEPIGANPVAVLSYEFWQTRLGSEPSVIGQPITVNGKPFTIVGVAPEGFDGTTLGYQPKIFVPISMRGTLEPGFADFEQRTSYWIYAFARLARGVTMTRAKRGVDAIYRPIINEVEAPLQKGLSDKTMARFRAKQVGMSDGSRGQSLLSRQVRTPLVLLIGITAIVLVIACANIANLLLARAAARSTEMAVRLSLGASRRQLVTQLVAEACLLAGIGWVASLLVTNWTLAGLAALLPHDTVGAVRFVVDPNVVAFAAGLSLLTGLLFGVYPAVESTRPDLVTTLRESSGRHSATRAATRFRSSLVTAQIAMSMALLVAAGLFVRSLINVTRVDLGLDIDNVVMFAISPERNGYTAEQSHQLLQRTEAALRGMPGVKSVTESLVGLLAGRNKGHDVEVDGWKSGPDINSNARVNEVGAGYFASLGVPVLSGREFTASDRLGRPRVAVVNESFAKKFQLGRDVLGKHMARSGAKINDIEIVGLVRDSKYSQVKDAVPPVYFVPWAQDSTVGTLTFYVRTSADARRMMRTIPRVLARLDPNLPVEGLKMMTQQVRDRVYLDRMISTLSAAFAVLATLLAAVGLYGVLAYTVAQRTREFGVRMALGADASRVRGMVLRQVGRMTVVGGAIGIVAALVLEETARSLLYGLEGHDPLVMIGAGVVLALVALGAGYVPARRASRIHPMQALRYE